MLGGSFCSHNVASHVITLFCCSWFSKLSWHKMMTAILSVPSKYFADILSIRFSSMPFTRPKHLLLAFISQVSSFPNLKHPLIIISVLPTLSPHIILHLLCLFCSEPFQSSINLLIHHFKSWQDTLLHLSY